MSNDLQTAIGLACLAVAAAAVIEAGVALLRAIGRGA